MRWDRAQPDSMTPVYLDYAASSPIPGVVLEEMIPWLQAGFGNPSSVHAAGRAARHVVEESRDKIATLLGARSEEIIFTSGGTEANHLAILGWSGSGPVVTSTAEHAAILAPVEALEKRGHRVSRVQPDADGRVAPALVAKSMENDGLASVMLVNNELGTINPVRAVADLCHEMGARIHCDAIQGPAFLNLDVDDLGVDLLSLSAHKVGGPKGTGILYVRSGCPLNALSTAGGQERDRRGGTENVAGIVGMAAALTWQSLYGASHRKKMARLNARLRAGLLALLGDRIVINSPSEGCAPHILSVGVSGVPPQTGGEMLILGMDLEGVQVSAGSACSSGALSPSHVLTAIGRDQDSAVRFSIGWGTTEADIDYAIDAAAKVITRVRASL
ncbi:MAG: cysteine desulfurase [Rhodothermales bacterium]|jgi:cysteine desulfurase